MTKSENTMAMEGDKAMAKTKAIKRWAVRRDKQRLLRDAWYLLFIGPRPRKPAKGWSPSHKNCVGSVCPRIFERFVLECFHLKPGGGPVQIEFKET